MSAIAGRVLLIPKGNYDSTATYTMLDMVVYNGSSYICKQECTGVVPTNTTYWMLNASGSAVAYINDIGDVVITNVSNGQVLMYDSTTQKWVNGTISTTLSGLTDTQIASLSNGQVLKYNSTSQKWENADEAGGILPHLIVISETGSTVTATKGTTVITATETSTGHFECDLTELGTWTIDAILGGDDAQVSLVVDTVKVYTVDDSHFHATVTVKYPSGATCRLQSADETLYATGSPYTFTVHHAETYTITVTYNQRIYTDTVTFTTEGQSFSKTLPSPSEVDANDIDWWLWYGGVSGTFSSLAEILANSTALSMLMSSTDAVDYLVRCKEWIDNKVPIMTSNTTPKGVAFASSVGTQGDEEPYKAFDGDSSTRWTSVKSGTTSYSNIYIGYSFASPKCINKCHVLFATGTNSVTYKIQGSNDGTTWNDVSEIQTQTSSNLEKTFTFSNSNSYISYRILITSQTVPSSDYNGGRIITLELSNDDICNNQSAMSYIGLNNYCANTLLADADWRDGIWNSTYFESVLNVKVPVMTNNTTPSGEASASSSTGDAYKVFNGITGVSGSYWNTSNYANAYVRYRFTEPVCVKALYFETWAVQKSLQRTTTAHIQGSNDGVNFDEIIEFSTPSSTEDNIKFCFENNTEYLYYQVKFDGATYGSSNGSYAFVDEMQFYGREDV